MGGHGGQLVEGLWGCRTEENGAKQQGIRSRVPAERMGLGEESGTALFLGCQRGLGIIGAGVGSGKEKERGGGNLGCLVGMVGVQGDLWGSRAAGMAQWRTGKSWTIRKQVKVLRD